MLPEDMHFSPVWAGIAIETATARTSWSATIQARTAALMKIFKTTCNGFASSDITCA